MIEIESHQVHLANSHLLGDADGPVAVGETSEIEHRGFRTGLGGHDHRALEPPGPFADRIRIISVRIREEILSELDKIASESNYSRNELINLILDYGIKHIEIE